MNLHRGVRQNKQRPSRLQQLPTRQKFFAGAGNAVNSLRFRQSRYVGAAGPLLNRKEFLALDVKMRALMRKNSIEIGHVDCICSVRRKSRPIHNVQIRSGGYMGKDLETRGIENQVKSSVKEMKGQVRGDLGDATDNASSEHIKGRAEELKGQDQKNFGKGSHTDKAHLISVA